MGIGFFNGDPDSVSKVEAFLLGKESPIPWGNADASHAKGYQQGRVAGIEASAKLADELDGPISMRRLCDAIRALIKKD